LKKLLKLKNWLTLPEAARHLSEVLGEPVNEGDILQLAIQNKLMLSVMFPDGIRGQECEAVPEEDLTFTEVSSIDGKGTVLIPNPPIAFYDPSGVAYTEKSRTFWLETDSPFELTMLGGEAASVEASYWSFATGKAHEAGMSPWGTFVKQGKRYFKLMDALPSVLVPGERVGPPKDYYGLGQLPSSAVFVVETMNMLRFEQSIEEASASKVDEEKPLKSRERNSLLTIIGALLELVQSPRPGREDGQAAIISELLDNYSEKEGISKSNLENRFAEANRCLRSR
jgi:hypothetical protein